MLVHWNPDQIALHLGPIALHGDSLFWTIGLAAAYYVVLRLYRQQKISQEKFDPLFFYCFLGILLGQD